MNLSMERYKKVLSDKDAQIERLKNENKELKNQIQLLKKELNQSKSVSTKNKCEEDYYTYHEEPPYGCGGY